MIHTNEYSHPECLEEAAIRFLRSKYIDCDNRPSRQDQKLSRFKFVRTPQSVAKNNNNVGVNSTTDQNRRSFEVFNKDLHTLKLSPVRLEDDVTVEVPFFLLLLVDELRKHKGDEGILRKSGSIARQNALIDRINKGDYDFTECNPHDMCAVLKRFIRSIPSGLLPMRLRDVFVGTVKHHIATGEYDPLLACCLLLQKESLHLLIYLTRFLSEVAMDHRRNLMTVDNLATVFAPNLFCPESNTADQANTCHSVDRTGLLSNKTKHYKGNIRHADLNLMGAEKLIVRLLIINAFRIGYIPRQVEKESYSIHIDNQETALNAAKLSTPSHNKWNRSFHFRSSSTRPEQCCKSTSDAVLQQTEVLNFKQGSRAGTPSAVAVKPNTITPPSSSSATLTRGAYNNLEFVKKRSNRNRSLFARKKRKDNDIYENSLHGNAPVIASMSERTKNAASRSLLRFTKKAKLFCSISEDEKRVATTNTKKHDGCLDVAADTGDQRQNQTSSKSTSPVTPSTAPPLTQMESISLRSGVGCVVDVSNKQTQRNLLCIPESPSERNRTFGSFDEQECKENCLDMALIFDDSNDGLCEAAVKPDTVDQVVPNCTNRRMQTLVEQSSSRQRTGDRVSGHQNLNEALTEPSCQTQKIKIFEDDPGDMLISVHATRQEVRRRSSGKPLQQVIEKPFPFKDEENPIVKAYHNCSPTKRGKYLDEFMRDVANVCPQSNGRIFSSSTTVTARQMCESVSNASWLRKKNKFKRCHNRSNPSNAAASKRAAASKSIVFTYKGTPV